MRYPSRADRGVVDERPEPSLEVIGSWVKPAGLFPMVWVQADLAVTDTEVRLTPISAVGRRLVGAGLARHDDVVEVQCGNDWVATELRVVLRDGDFVRARDVQIGEANVVAARKVFERHGYPVTPGAVWDHAPPRGSDELRPPERGIPPIRLGWIAGRLAVGVGVLLVAVVVLAVLASIL
jgi:hypothetical protein